MVFVPRSSFFVPRTTTNEERTTNGLPQRLLRGRAAEVLGGELERSFVEAELARGDVEDRGDLLGEDAFTAAAHAPLRIVELAAAQIADPVQHFVFSIREAFLEPLFEEGCNGPRQTQHHESR